MVMTALRQDDGTEGLGAIAEALQLFTEGGWDPPWALAASYELNIHDALFEVTNGDFESYIDAVELLNDQLGEDVMLWEREPHRTEDDIIELFEKVLNG